MTALALNAGPTSFSSSSAGAAASDVADRLRRLWFDQTLPELMRADTWNRLGDSIFSLRDIHAECAVGNWDGYGAKAISAGAFEEAFAILNALPMRMRLPELTPEPDGSIGMEWENGPARILALSVNGTGVVVYAGMLGKGSKAHGTEVFNDSLPESILGYIQRV